MDRNTTEVAIAQFTALGVSLSDVEESLQITSLVLAVTFGIYKWVAEIIKIKNKRKGGRKQVLPLPFPLFPSFPLLTKKRVMQEVLSYLLSNGAELLLSVLATAKVIVRLTPSVKDDKVFGLIDDLVNFFIKNNEKKTEE